MADGILLARFMPPHDGHQRLLDFASHYAERLRILIPSQDDDPIPAEQRMDWVRRLYNPLCQSEIVDLPLRETAAQEWAEHIQGLAGWKPRYIFGLEKLGHALAKKIGAKFVIVSPTVEEIEMVSDSLRVNPAAYWGRIPGSIRHDFLKRVCVFGPESTGKSTLCEKLSRHFCTVAVPEYSRTYLEQKEQDYELSDVVPVARGQRAWEYASSPKATRVLFCDTDLLTLKIWSNWLFGECPTWIEERLDRESYDLYLLCCSDVPWKEDDVRYLPNDRENFEAKCEQTLRDHGCRYVKLSGGWEERFRKAVRAVDELLSEPWPQLEVRHAGNGGSKR